MAAIAGIDWAAWRTTAWTVAQQAATSGLVFLAGLPRDCYLATAHAGMVCTERNPEYTTMPGFGPFAVGWGWLCLGGVAGALLTLSFLAVTGRIKQEPSISQLAALMQPTSMSPSASSPRGDRGDLDLSR